MPYFSILNDMYSYIDKTKYMLTRFTSFKSYITPFESITARVLDTYHNLSRVVWPSISQFHIRRALEPLIKAMCFVRFYRACKLTREVSGRQKFTIFVAIGTFTWPLVRLPDQWAVVTAVVPAECSVGTDVHPSFMQARSTSLICERSEFLCHRFFSP